MSDVSSFLKFASLRELLRWPRKSLSIWLIISLYDWYAYHVRLQLMRTVYNHIWFVKWFAVIILSLCINSYNNYSRGFSKRSNNLQKDAFTRYSSKKSSRTCPPRLPYQFHDYRPTWSTTYKIAIKKYEHLRVDFGVFCIKFAALSKPIE